MVCHGIPLLMNYLCTNLLFVYSDFVQNTLCNIRAGILGMSTMELHVVVSSEQGGALSSVDVFYIVLVSVKIMVSVFVL